MKIEDPALLTTRGAVLTEALEIVHHDRNADYGSPKENYLTTAKMWSGYKGVEFSAHDVAVMMILLKVSRIVTSPTKLDHWIDIAGYAACGAEATE